MIIGLVHPDGYAVVPLRLRGAASVTIDTQAIIDTGFNHFLTLPPSLIQSLGLSFREQGRYAFADASETIAKFFTAELEWFTDMRRIIVLEMEGTPLLGMALLRGTHVRIDVITGGRVEIRPLTTE